MLSEEESLHLSDDGINGNSDGEGEEESCFFLALHFF